MNPVFMKAESSGHFGNCSKSLELLVAATPHGKLVLSTYEAVWRQGTHRPGEALRELCDMSQVQPSSRNSL